MGATKDIASAAMPYVVLAAIIGAAWMFRDQIAEWFNHTITDPIVSAVTDTSNPVVNALTAPARGANTIIQTVSDYLAGHPDIQVITGQQGTGIVPWTYDAPTAADIANAEVISVDSNITPWADNPVLHSLAGATVLGIETVGSGDRQIPEPSVPVESVSTFNPTRDALGFVIQPSERIVGILGENQVGNPIEIREEGSGATLLISRNEGTIITVGGDVAQQIVSAATMGRVVVPWAPTHTWAPGEAIPHIFAGEEAGALAVLDSNWHQQFGGS